MSLAPLIFSDWWEDLDRPHRIFDQHFGLHMDPEDFISPTRSEMLLYRPSRARRNSGRYHPFLHSLVKRNKGASTVGADKDKFQVTLDIQQFHPEEVNVKVVDNYVVVEAKHEEKEDEHGFISRQFTRKYLIPNQCDIDKVESQLSSDGVLTITAPKKEQPKLDSNERPIKIQFTGQPAITENSTSTNEESGQSRETGQRQAGQRGKKSTVKAA